MRAVASPVMATVDVTPLNDAERAARQQLHGFMMQHPALMQHTLHALCTGQRAVELLLLPPPFHGQIQSFLAAVRSPSSTNASVLRHLLFAQSVVLAVCTRRGCGDVPGSVGARAV